MEKKRPPRKKVPAGANRMPENSIFYDKLVPILLVTLGVIMLGLIVIAAGILLGII